ncbi:hypothetical protein BN1708_017978, partial [Verticillium longisporum]
ERLSRVQVRLSSRPDRRPPRPVALHLPRLLRPESHRPGHRRNPLRCPLGHSRHDRSCLRLRSPAHCAAHIHDLVHQHVLHPRPAHLCRHPQGP